MSCHCESSQSAFHSPYSAVPVVSVALAASELVCLSEGCFDVVKSLLRAIPCVVGCSLSVYIACVSITGIVMLVR